MRRKEQILRDISSMFVDKSISNGELLEMAVEIKDDLEMRIDALKEEMS